MIYIYSCWCFNYVWCMRYYSCNFTYTCNQWKSNTSCQSTMQWTNSTSSLLWLSQRKEKTQKTLSPSLKSTNPYIKRKISLNILTVLWLFNVIRISMKLSCSHFSTGPHTNLKFSPHFALFPLKDRTRSSLESKGSHTKRKKILSTLLSLSFPRVLNQNKENSLKLSTSHTSGSSH